MIITKTAVPPAYAQRPSITREVRGLVDKGDFAGAQKRLDSDKAAQGVTPTWLEANSWVARGHLNAKHYDEADKYAAQTRNFVLPLLKTRKLDDEKSLPLALGASIEVQAQVMAARGDRAEAVAFLNTELAAWRETSIRTRIQKNLNLISLVGRHPLPLDAREFVGPKPPTLGSLKGRTVVLFFWAHWCGDCKAMSGALARLAMERPGIAIIGPTQTYGYGEGGIEVPRAAEIRYIDSVRQAHYASVAGMTVPLSEEIFKLWGVSTTPTIAVINKQGIVSLYHPGRMTYDELIAHVGK